MVAAKRLSFVWFTRLFCLLVFANSFCSESLQNDLCSVSDTTVLIFQGSLQGIDLSPYLVVIEKIKRDRSNVPSSVVLSMEHCLDEGLP